MVADRDDIDPTRPAARRAVIAGAGLVAGATLLPEAANAAASYTPRQAPDIGLLPTQGHHLVGRFAYGVTPELAHQVRSQGGARAWFDRQLSPERIRDRGAGRVVGWFPGLSWTPAHLWHQNLSGMPGWQVMEDYQSSVLLRRIMSRRQLLETMTEFWENHFHVPVYADGVFTWRKRYGDVIRARALDSFESLLRATATHPAMGMYLGNAVSDKNHPNENQGRELLELHTVGVGNYTEDDVKSSARILTGYQVDMWNTWSAGYNELAHWTGPVRVGSFRAANRSSDGRPVTKAYLHHLAHHPDTAHRIATKLATVFVRDHPPSSLVDRLARVYLAHGTQVRPVLRALVDSSAFRASVGAKVRDPEGDLVATYRALGITIRKPTVRESAPHQIIWQAGTIGQGVGEWPRPDGQPVDNGSWASPSRMLGSLSTHYGLSGGWWPTQDIHYRKPTSWLPRPSVRFDVLVDHMSQQILHRHASATLLQACCQAVDAKPSTVVDRNHPVMRWLFPRLLTTFLDSPQHFRR
jgi:Protein of unknown function (DUF1800)